MDFQVTSKLNRLDNKVSGKGKKGAQFLQTDAPLCIITGNSGVKYVLYRFVIPILFYTFSSALDYYFKSTIMTTLIPD